MSIWTEFWRVAVEGILSITVSMVYSQPMTRSYQGSSLRSYPDNFLLPLRVFILSADLSSNYLDKLSDSPKCLCGEAHWTSTQRNGLTPQEWCLIREICWAVTQTSCQTFPKSGMSSERIIKQLPGQVVWLSLYSLVTETGIFSGRLTGQLPWWIVQLPQRVTSH